MPFKAGDVVVLDWSKMEDESYLGLRRPDFLMLEVKECWSQTSFTANFISCSSSKYYSSLLGLYSVRYYTKIDRATIGMVDEGEEL